LTDLNGRQYQLSSLRGKWLYVYFGSARCAQHCQDVLYKTRQVILAQDKHQDRVQRLLVLTDAEGLADLASKLAEHPGLWVARPDAKVLDAFARDFHAAAGGALAGQDRVYLLDPLGNLMMSYAADADATGLRKDLARLLRVSRVG
jgi:cytochrome oxidase Cu insertion factor (SCO1/SenC/PrrC family)